MERKSVIWRPQARDICPDLLNTTDVKDMQIIFGSSGIWVFDQGREQSSRSGEMGFGNWEEEKEKNEQKSMLCLPRLIEVIVLVKNKERMVLLADRETIKNNNGKKARVADFSHKNSS